MQDDRFEWDDAKAAENFRKHGVSLKLAAEAFDDPNWIETDDPEPSERRYNRVCMRSGRVFMVTYTERDERVRIISARLATRHEQRAYFDGQA